MKVPYYTALLIGSQHCRIFNDMCMRNNEQRKKVSVRRPEVRSLKIQPRFRVNRNSTVDVPEIRLCGNWLESLGFKNGRRVSITTKNELLIVRLQDE